MTRIVFLDTETTGIDPEDHRVIEIGALEMVDRQLTGKSFHEYINPKRSIDPGALKVHGITEESLQDKPEFTAIADALLTFIDGAEVIMHNASFDQRFIDAELRRIGKKVKMEDCCKITDSLKMARSLYPMQKNSLDALCNRLGVSNQHRTLHGALIDTEILAEVYLKMTSSQEELNLKSMQKDDISAMSQGHKKKVRSKIVNPSTDEMERLQQFLEKHLKIN